MLIQEDIFGHLVELGDGFEIPVKRYTLKSKTNVTVQLISYGATISNVIVPDKDGNEDSVTLGFDNLEDYTKYNYLGSTIGRHGNRIGKGQFMLDGKEFQLSINNNENHLHGGKRGFDKHIWDSSIEGDCVVFSLHRPDGDEGYPGDVIAQTTYRLDDHGSLHIDFQAISTKPTPINMTNHAFFNLAGHCAGEKGLFQHVVQLNCDKYLAVSPDLIPTGKLVNVDDTPFDLRSPIDFGSVIPNTPDQGYDHCFCISKKKKRNTVELAGRMTHPPTGRSLEVYTSEPGVQIYTGNFLPKEQGKMIGRDSKSYTYHGSFCAEPQNFPDAINKAHFPNSVLRPGNVYKHSMIYSFQTEKSIDSQTVSESNCIVSSWCSSEASGSKHHVSVDHNFRSDSYETMAQNQFQDHVKCTSEATTSQNEQTEEIPRPQAQNTMDFEHILVWGNWDTK